LHHKYYTELYLYLTILTYEGWSTSPWPEAEGAEWSIRNPHEYNFNPLRHHHCKPQVSTRSGPLFKDLWKLVLSCLKEKWTTLVYEQSSFISVWRTCHREIFMMTWSQHWGTKPLPTVWLRSGPLSSNEEGRALKMTPVLEGQWQWAIGKQLMLSMTWYWQIDELSSDTLLANWYLPRTCSCHNCQRTPHDEGFSSVGSKTFVTGQQTDSPQHFKGQFGSFWSQSRQIHKTICDLGPSLPAWDERTVETVEASHISTPKEGQGCDVSWQGHGLGLLGFRGSAVGGLPSKGAYYNRDILR